MNKVAPLMEALRKEKDRAVKYLRDQARQNDHDALIDRLSRLFDRYGDSNQALAEILGWLPHLWALGRLLDLTLKTHGDCRAVCEAIEQHFEQGTRELMRR